MYVMVLKCVHLDLTGFRLCLMADDSRFKIQDSIHFIWQKYNSNCTQFETKGKTVLILTYNKDCSSHSDVSG